MSATSYTTSNPLWNVTVNLAPGAVITYKYIKVESSGTVTWESDPDRTYTAPSTCATTALVANTWQ